MAHYPQKNTGPMRLRSDYGQRLTFGVELEFVVAYLTPDMIYSGIGDVGKVRVSYPLPDYKELPKPTINEAKRKPPRGVRWRLRDVEPDNKHFENIADWWTKQFSEHGPPIRHRIAKYLRALGVPAISDSADAETVQCTHDQQEQLAKRLGYDNAEEMPEHFDYSTLWKVETDTSVGEDALRSFDWTPVEIKSPVLYYDDESIKLVRYVVNSLVNEFRIMSNESTMLHVHVGRGDRGFTMNDLRST